VRTNQEHKHREQHLKTLENYIGARYQDEQTNRAQSNNYALLLRHGLKDKIMLENKVNINEKKVGRE